MTRLFSVAALVLGLVIIVWMGFSFIDTNTLAFVVTSMIAVVFIVGFVELSLFQRDTDTLNTQLSSMDEPPSVLDEWLQLLPSALRDSVRLRIQGEYKLLPSPILTPYLVGLLVMLGLLGTFAGMVDTLRGAVAALQGTTELEAIREGLTAPMAGLGLAFGTSVAGISASALLGFIATISRHQRVQASRLLDRKIREVLQGFSLAYKREQTFTAMQQQARDLPVVADKLVSLAEHLEQFSDNIRQQLTDNQAQFHQEMGHTYQELARSVEQSLKQSVGETSRLIGESMQPLVADMASTVSQNMEVVQTRLADSVEQQFGHVTGALLKTSEDVVKAWQQGLSEHQASSDALGQTISQSFDSLRDNIQQSCEASLAAFAKASEQWVHRQQEQDQQRLQQWHNTFEQTSSSIQQSADALSVSAEGRSREILSQITALLQSAEGLIESRADQEHQWLSAYEARMQALNDAQAEHLSLLREAETQRQDTTVHQLQALQADVTSHLQTLGNSLELPITRLIETASETPRTAAEVISQLRHELSNSIERDNQLLDERQQIFTELQTVTDNLRAASTEQGQALETLVSNVNTHLNEVSQGFTQQMENQSTRLNGVVDHIASSAVEFNSLGDAFATAIEHFGQSNRDLMEMLSVIEASLQSSAQRSDEQMTYYVAQAREIIDQTVSSQQEVIEQLRQLNLPVQAVANG